MLVLEQASRHDIRPTIQVFGTDLDTKALATAREGKYPAAIEADVSEDRLRRFFIREDNHYRACNAFHYALNLNGFLMLGASSCSSRSR
jgi:chemotaxis methyl-accepting protein methylase